MTEEHKKKIALAHIGMKLSDEVKKKKSLSMKKRWASDAGYRDRMSKAHIGNRGYWTGIHRFFGEKHWLWKGGITSTNTKIRRSIEYKLWRTSVFERDGYTCIWCGYKGKNLNADHIKPFAYYPELRFAIDNGRTLCKECHKTTDTYGSKCLKYDDQ